MDDAVEVVLSEVVGIFTPKEEQKTAQKAFLIGKDAFVSRRCCYMVQLALKKWIGPLWM